MITKKVSFTGEGIIYNIHPILKPTQFKKNGNPNEMIANDIIGPAIEIGVIKNKLSVEVDGRHLRKSKGPYIMFYNYFSHIIPCPAVAYQMASNVKFAQIFHIALQEEELFKTKKLQLLKSKYEFPFEESDYGIIPDMIAYDGQIIKGENIQSYNPNEYELYPSLPIAYFADDPLGFEDEEYDHFLNDALNLSLQSTSHHL